MSPRTTRKKKDTLTAEFTTNQLVIGMCVALLFATAFFALGVVVGKTDPSLNPEQAEEQVATNAPASTATSPTTLERPLSPTKQMLPGNQTARNQPAPPRSRREPYVPKLTPKEQPALPVGQQPQTRKVELPAPPAESEKPEEPAVLDKPMEEVQKQAAAEPAAETSPDDTANKEEPVKEAPAKPEIKEIEPIETVEETSSTTTPEEAPISAPVDDGSFGIQVAAYLQPDGTQKANNLQKELKTAFNIDAKIYTSSDNNYSKVIIPGFKTRPDAVKACDEIKKKDAKLANAWVTTIPQ